MMIKRNAEEILKVATEAFNNASKINTEDKYFDCIVIFREDMTDKNRLFATISYFDDFGDELMYVESMRDMFDKYGTKYTIYSNGNYNFGGNLIV